MKKKMTDMRVGDTGVIKEIPEDISTIISAMGLRKEQTVKLTAIQPARGPFVVTAKNIDISVSWTHANRILVEV